MRLLLVLMFNCTTIALGEAPNAPTALRDDEAMIRGSRRNSMKGLVGVYIRVSPLEPAARGVGLSAARLQEDIESRLRSAAIPVFTPMAGKAQPGQSHLELLVTVVQPVETVMVFGLRLALVQNTYLERKLDRVFRSSTWGINMTGYMDRADSDSIRAEVQLLVDSFCEDFHAVNGTGPRPGTPLLEIKYDGPLEACRRWDQAEDFIQKLIWEYSNLLEHFGKDAVLAAAKGTCRRRVSSPSELDHCVACVRQIIERESADAKP